MSAPVVAFDLEDVAMHVGIGQRLGRKSIVCRHTGEPLQVITVDHPRHIASLLAQWDVFYDQAKRKAEAPR